MKKNARSFSLALTALALTTLGQTAFAHDGHGLGNTHWHATDTLGFVIAAALVAVAVYFGKK
jgi:predicted anti-sigma-YlaC factor YlaD